MALSGCAGHADFHPSLCAPVLLSGADPPQSTSDGGSSNSVSSVETSDLNPVHFGVCPSVLLLCFVDRTSSQQ